MSCALAAVGTKLQAALCFPALLAHGHRFASSGSLLTGNASIGAAILGAPPVASVHVAAPCSSMASAEGGPGADKRPRAEDPEPEVRQSEVLQVKKLSEKATIPTRGSEGAAGYDLSSAEEAVIPARGKGIVKTDLAIAIPLGTYARVAPRSGLAAKHSIDVGAGVVDYDYRGNVGVILFNFSDKDFQVNVGDRVAQLILERIMTPPVEEVEELDVTLRGAGGFGSTGVGVITKTV